MGFSNHGLVLFDCLPDQIEVGIFRQAHRAPVDPSDVVHGLDASLRVRPFLDEEPIRRLWNNDQVNDNCRKTNPIVDFENTLEVCVQVFEVAAGNH